MRPLLLMLIALPVVACTTTTAVSRADLKRGIAERGADIVLRGTDGSSARLDPNSALRLCYRGGRCSRWIGAGELHVTPGGLSFPERRGGKQRVAAAWSEIDHTEVRNLSGAKTLGAVVGAAVVVAAVVAVAYALGSGGKGKIGGSKGKSRGRAKRARGARPSSRRLHRRSPGRARRGAALAMRGALSVAVPEPHHHHHPSPAPPPPPPPPVDEGLAVAEPEELAEGPAEGPALPPAGAATGPVAQAADVEATPGEALATPGRPDGPLLVGRGDPLFSGRQQRQARIRLVGAVDLGTELNRPRGLSDGLFAGIRLFDSIELGARLRHTLTEVEVEGGQISQRTMFSAAGYVGVHLALDARRRFAAVVGGEVGTGSSLEAHAVIDVGLRIQPTDWIFVGIYPFNPRYDAFDDPRWDEKQRWSFPTRLEVGFAF